MGASKVDYEESRKLRMEENKKRLEELNLNKLSEALRTSSPKPSPVKRGRPNIARLPLDLSAVRRSSRVANQPPPNYREVPVQPLERAGRSYTYKRRDLLNRIYASDEARAYAIDKAEVLKSGLEQKFPSFVKPMLQSHVTGGFWLGLPVHFCKTHLPTRDEIFILEDENGNESSTKYLAEKTGLSAGWRGFAIDHELVDGDAVVFHLIKPRKFKVYIIRANQSYDSEEAQDVMHEDQDVTSLNYSAKRKKA